jgi:hypothetical protein
VRVVGRVTLAAVILAALAGVVPARAAVPTTWTAPLDLDGPNEVGSPVAVGIDAAGTGLAIWLADTGTSTRILRSATRPAGGEWSAPIDRTDRVEISDPIAFAQDPSGRAIVAWSQWNGSHSTVHAATVLPDGAWTAPIEVSPPLESTNFVQASMDESGHAVLAWNSEAGIKSATFTFGGGWSAIDTLTANSQATAVQIASDAAGDVTATWWLQFDHQVQATSRPAGGAWTSPETLSAGGVETSIPFVAELADGGAVAAWSELHGTDEVLVTADRASGGTWSAPVDLVGVLTSTLAVLRADRTGSVLLVFGDRVGTDVALFSTSRSASGTWSAVTPASPPGSDVLSSSLATNPGGDALLATDLTAADGTSRTWVRSLPRGGSWSPPELVSGTSTYTGGAQAAVDDAGDAVVAWSTDGTIPPKVQAVTSPAPVAPPTPSAVPLVPRFTG